MVKCEDIVKKFNIGTPDETTLFDRFSFEVQEGEFVSIVGSNGSGKTTLLNIICGTLPVELSLIHISLSASSPPRSHLVNRPPAWEEYAITGRWGCR